VCSRDDDLVLRLQRTLPASREAVYRALTEPAMLARWWGPQGFTTPCIEFRPHVGRGLRIAMQPPAGEPFHLVGEFLEVEPPIRLSYTFRWEPPHADDLQTTAVLLLRPRPEGTSLSLVQGQFATAERRALHEDGWTDSLDRLEQLFTS
jgi:uncharacterized protein YndB with AHSA1/START domain